MERLDSALVVAGLHSVTLEPKVKVRIGLDTSFMALYKHMKTISQPVTI